MAQRVSKKAPQKTAPSPRQTRPGISYKDAGVSIDEADRAVSSIRTLARKTFTSGVLTDIGSFGGGFLLKGYREPVLVSSADGVGTKLKLAFLTGRHSTIGEDLVNHCVNDIAVQGAVPLFFLDYFAVGKLDARVAAEVISGIARGCKANGCALIGGETAEMPGFYRARRIRSGGLHRRRGRAQAHPDRREDPHRRRAARLALHRTAHQRLLAGAQTALRCRRARAFDPPGRLRNSIGDELLKLHRSYLKPLRALDDAGLLKGAAHITGGGITDNTPRILPKGLGVRIDLGPGPCCPSSNCCAKSGAFPSRTGGALSTWASA